MASRSAIISSGVRTPLRLGLDLGMSKGFGTRWESVLETWTAAGECAPRARPANGRPPARQGWWNRNRLVAVPSRFVCRREYSMVVLPSVRNAWRPADVSRAVGSRSPPPSPYLHRKWMTNSQGNRISQLDSVDLRPFGGPVGGSPALPDPCLPARPPACVSRPVSEQPNRSQTETHDQTLRWKPVLEHDRNPCATLSKPTDMPARTWADHVGPRNRPLAASASSR